MVEGSDKTIRIGYRRRFEYRVSRMRRRRDLIEERAAPAELVRRVARIALPLDAIADIDPLLDRIGDAHYVLLGEASHGTSEYYQWRTEIYPLRATSRSRRAKQQAKGRL